MRRSGTKRVAVPRGTGARRSPAREMSDAWVHGVWELARTDAPWLHGPYNANGQATCHWTLPSLLNSSSAAFCAGRVKPSEMHRRVLPTLLHKRQSVAANCRAMKHEESTTGWSWPCPRRNYPAGEPLDSYLLRFSQERAADKNSCPIGERLVRRSLPSRDWAAALALRHLTPVISFRRQRVPRHVWAIACVA